MLAPPDARPRPVISRAGARLLALWLVGGAGCGGAQRADAEPPLTFADPADCHCKVTDDDLAPAPGDDGVPPIAGTGDADDGQAAAAAQAPPPPLPDAAAIAARYAGEDDAAKPPRWTGRPIDFNVNEADVPNVLRLLAEAGQVDMVIADDVVGTVSLRLGKVPWDQALDAVIRLEGLSVSRNGQVLLIRRGP